MFGSILGALGSGLLGLGSSALDFGLGMLTRRQDYKYQKRLQDDAQAHQIYMYQNQNQWRVNDLRAAGLNPILATHAGSSMPSSAMGHVNPVSSDSSRLTEAISSAQKAIANRPKKENELLDAQINEVKARTGEIKGRSKVSNAVGDIAKEGSSLFSSAKNVSDKFGSFIGSNLGDLFFNRKKYTLPTSGFSARDEKFLDELIKEDDARRGKNWQHVGTRVGNRIYIYKKAK